ncbi:MAG: hypothetical protein JO297_18090 [Nitrososphaeraceae archaeon]|nr:hypothetical protein [Nitrososphaeraceae archaeon]
MEARGGTIWAENNADGIGATFAFSLPLTKNNNSNWQLHLLLIILDSKS